MITETAFAGLAAGLLSASHAREGNGLVPLRAAVTPEQPPFDDYLVYRRRMKATEQQSRLDDVYQQDGAVAIITIDGVIDRNLSQFEMECYGGCDLADIDRALDVAANDPNIRYVLLVVRSPGGSVIGVPETAAKVAALALKKTVYSFTDTICGSAGYFIACQAERMFCTPSAIVGSIGVYSAVLDASGWYKNQGLNMQFFKDGDFKGAGLDFKPLSPDEAKMFQQRVLQLGAIFRGAVTASRPGVELATMQGQSFIGQDPNGGPDAVGCGLVDQAVLCLADAIAAF